MTSTDAAPARTPARQSWRRVTVILFGSSGRIDWIAAWVYIALIAGLQGRVILTLQRNSPDLLAERNRVGEGTKAWDKILAPLVAFVLPLAKWLTAGLDMRFSGASHFSTLVQVGGFAIAAASAELTARAMAANRFFAATVRIQTERGHSVVSAGPYAVVRHPGCVGMLGFTLAAPLALGSALAFWPAGVCAVLLIVRTALEDRMLRAELSGYAEYSQRVRWRLLPWVW